tara:strand:- start:446 stop:1144 length:699 start_codon:yes stop_codon:yes gene_type:complete
MRNLIFIVIIFFTIFVLYKKDIPSKFVKSSFDKKISKIQIENLKNLSPKIILDSIYLKEGDYFWKFNPKRLKRDFEKINEIKNYNFSLKKNGILYIFIVEKKPYMIWTFSNKKKFIDDKGNVLRFSGLNTDQLIQISGYLNKKKLSYLNNALEKKNEFKSSIQNIYYYENTGWKIILRDKTCVILPEKKLNNVLNFFENKIKNSKIYYDYKFYDMRVLERVYLSKKNKCLNF